MACKPLPIFSNMPWHVKQKIVGFTDPYTQKNLQLCSKDLQKVVDKAPPVYGELGISLRHSEIIISISNRTRPSCFGQDRNDRTYSINFENRDGRVLIEKLKSCRVQSLVEVEGDYLEEAFKYLGKIFYKTPRRLVTVQNVIIKMAGEDEVKNEFLRRLREFTRTSGLLHAQKLNIDTELNERHFVTVLQNFQPGFLKSISLYNNLDRVDDNESRTSMLTDVIALEQWKQAKELSCIGIKCTAPYETWCHLDIRYMNTSSISLDVLKDMIQRIGQSANWSRMQLKVDQLPQNVQDYYNQLPMFPVHTKLRKVDIPDCNTHYLNVFLVDNVFMVDKYPYDE